MKSILGIVFLIPIFLFIGNNKSVETVYPLPDSSEWKLAENDISLKIKGDSLFWTINSGVKGVPSIVISAQYVLSTSGRINLTCKLPLLSQDLSYVYGEKNAELYQRIVRTSFYSLKNNRLAFYSLKDDSIVFYRKK